MRTFINILNEADDLAALKVAVANKIHGLPETPATEKALSEIEELLHYVDAGGKKGIIDAELKSINDKTVRTAHQVLARYILSIDQTPDQRNELFELWRSDKLIDTKKLITVGARDFSEIVTSYSSNSMIRELVNQLMRISALGQGKGEFGLSVLSQSIHKQEGKGDLSINGRPIEVKTTDGGAGRFTDQEVVAAAGFDSAARALTAFVANNESVPVVIPTSGISLKNAVSYTSMYEGEEQAAYLKLVETVITQIFGGKKTSDIDEIMQAFKDDNPNAAAQAYARANFNYYMSMKKDDGVLYISLGTEPITTVYFRDADDLTANALRLHASTAYLTSTADKRLPYPQMEIVPTTFGANAAAKAEKDQKAAAVKQARLDAANAKRASQAAKIASGSSYSGIRPPGTPTAAPAPRATLSLIHI